MGQKLVYFAEASVEIHWVYPNNCIRSLAIDGAEENLNPLHDEKCIRHSSALPLSYYSGLIPLHRANKDTEIIMVARPGVLFPSPIYRSAKQQFIPVFWLSFFALVWVLECSLVFASR
jgi:hypothetical protein